MQLSCALPCQLDLGQPAYNGCVAVVHFIRTDRINGSLLANHAALALGRLSLHAGTSAARC